MISGILGKKIGMTQLFQEDGKLVPVTVLQAGPCYVLQVKTQEKDGYSSLQLGLEDKKEKNTPKPEIGHTQKASTTPKRFIREIPYSNSPPFQPGQAIGVEVFTDTKKVDITGLSKGKGFQGVMKRWGFVGGPATHGSTRHRAPGSIGSNTDPARVWKGKRMSGHMGMERVTVQNIDVVKIDAQRNLLMIKGAVPGAEGSFVIIRKSVKE
ncbi:MAG TPA: 50S ribosomal protein L3 [Candidatus Hypogeohydataceae bacterium YC41]